MLLSVYPIFIFTSDFLSNKKVIDWGIPEVGLWLDSVGCGEYKEIFSQHDIRGPELIALEKADLHVRIFFYHLSNYFLNNESL